MTVLTMLLRFLSFLGFVRSFIDLVILLLILGSLLYFYLKYLYKEDLLFVSLDEGVSLGTPFFVDFLLRSAGDNCKIALYCQWRVFCFLSVV